MNWLCYAVVVDGKLFTWKGGPRNCKQLGDHPRESLAFRYFPRGKPSVLHEAIIDPMGNECVDGWYAQWEKHPDSPGFFDPNKTDCPFKVVEERQHNMGAL